jgi:hypothetical protein
MDSRSPPFTSSVPMHMAVRTTFSPALRSGR